MKLKGNWAEGTSYSVGDVVVYDDGIVYHLQNACDAGTPPTNTLYWGMVDQITARAVLLIMDAVADLEAKIPTNIDDEGIVLKSGDYEYLVSVDASGETPEVIAELIEDESEEELPK